jgi:hypothetical protein
MNILDEGRDYGAFQDILSGISPHPKKRRGRPSKKNKPDPNTSIIKKSPGRPKGSPNRGPSKTRKNITAACTIQKYFRRYQIINTFNTIYS